MILPTATLFSFIVTTITQDSSGLRSRLNLLDFDFPKIENLFYASFSRNLVSSGTTVRFICLLFISCTILSLFVALFCRIDNLINSNQNILFELLLQISISSLITSLLFTFLSGGIVDEYFLRYFWPAIFMLMIFGSAFAAHIFKLFQKKVFINLRVEAILTAFLLIVFGVTSGSVPVKDTQFVSVANCLKDLRSNGVDLDSGVADYWFGRSVDYLSSSPNRTFVALNSLEPYYWMTTDSYYVKKANYNFILLHTQPDQFGFNFEIMGNLLPSSSRSFICQDTDIVVYFYENDSLNRLIQESIQRYFALNTLR
jgi:hypothetical protein